jgi:site-specific DNA-methyltransferase (adenine-specific)
METGMSDELYCGDFLRVLPSLGFFDCLVADPPDAIGLRYNSFNDNMSEAEYREFLWRCLTLFVEHAGISWISYNAKWTFMMGSLVERLLEKHDIEAKPFVTTFTFGQNNKHDCGNGHRPLLRLRHHDAPLYPDQIKVPSWRQLNGDKRAAKGGRVPLDHWNEFPRVTGNSKQRRRYHPTQLHEGLVKRCIQMSTEKGGNVLDVFSGTGTALRVCRRIDRGCTSVELDPVYSAKIAEEDGLSCQESPTQNSRSR